MDKLAELLTGLLPEADAQKVQAVLAEEMAKVKSDLEKTYNAELEKAYADLTEELKSSEDTAIQGYKEALGIIEEMKNRLSLQKTEMEKALEEGYEEAYQMIQTEKGAKEELEKALYEEYNKKLDDMKNYIVEKVDQFLKSKGTEIYEQAKQEVVNDPRIVEHKVAFSKVIDVVSEHINKDEYTAVANTKLEEKDKKIDELKGQVKILEARNIRISTENKQLTEAVKANAEVIKEHAAAAVAAVAAEKKARIETAENVEGKGKQVVQEQTTQAPAAPVQEEVVQETTTEAPKTEAVEPTVEDKSKEMNLKLAGIKK